MSKPSEIDQLIERTEQQISRLKVLEKGNIKSGTLVQRVSAHVGKHGHLLANALLAGCVFGVAWKQLQQKYSYERDIAQQDEKLSAARSEKLRLQDQVAALEQSHQRLREDVLRELDAGGMRLAPTAERLRGLLAEAGGGGDDTPAPRPLMPVPLPPQQRGSQSSKLQRHMI